MKDIKKYSGPVLSKMVRDGIAANSDLAKIGRLPDSERYSRPNLDRQETLKAIREKSLTFIWDFFEENPETDVVNTEYGTAIRMMNDSGEMTIQIVPPRGVMDVMDRLSDDPRELLPAPIKHRLQRGCR